MMRLLLVVIGVMSFTSCVRPVDYPISPNCEWMESDQRALDLATYSDRRHLRFDAVTAEDMAIRWADQRYGLRAEWDQQRRQCMETLFTGLAKTHGVDVATVRRYSRARDIVVDGPVILGFAIIFAWVAYVFAGRIRRRFPPGEPGFWVMTVTMSAGVSLIGVLLGMFAGIIVEEFRMGSGHLSYRMNRIPFRQHWVIFFAGGVVIFFLAPLLRYLADWHRANNDSSHSCISRERGSLFWRRGSEP